MLDVVPTPDALVAEAWRTVAPGGRLVVSNTFHYQELDTKSGLRYDIPEFLRADGIDGEPYRTMMPFPLRHAWQQIVAAYDCNIAVFRKHSRRGN